MNHSRSAFLVSTFFFFSVLLVLIGLAVAEAAPLPEGGNASGNATGARANEALTGVAAPSLSDDAQAFVRMLFRMPATTSVSFSDVVILGVLWLCFFIVLQGAFRLTPFFEQGVGAWLAAFITTWLIAAAGVIAATLAWLQGIQKGIQSLTASAAIAWGIVLLVFVVIAYCFFLLASLVRKKSRVDEAERAGARLGAET